MVECMYVKANTSDKPTGINGFVILTHIQINQRWLKEQSD